MMLDTADAVCECNVTCGPSLIIVGVIVCVVSAAILFVIVVLFVRYRKRFKARTEVTIAASQETTTEKQMELKE